MRNALRILKYIALLLLAAVLVLAVYVWRTWDRVWDVPPPDLHASNQPEAIEHGEYLVYGPAHCVLCLSARSTLPTSPRMRKPVSAGIRIPRLRVCCAMQYARTVRASVRPLMANAEMSDDDIVAILSFLRSQPPVRHAVPAGRPSPQEPTVKHAE